MNEFIAFIIPPDAIQSTDGELEVYFGLEKSVKWRQISLKFEGSKRKGLTETVPKMLSMSSKTLEVRVSNEEYYDSSRFKYESAIFANVGIT